MEIYNIDQHLKNV